MWVGCLGQATFHVIEEHAEAQDALVTHGDNPEFGRCWGVIAGADSEPLPGDGTPTRRHDDVARATPTLRCGAMGGIAIAQEKTAGRVSWGGDDERELLSRHEVVCDAHHRTKGHEGHLIRGHVVRYSSAREVRVGAGMIADEAREAGNALGRFDEIWSEVLAYGLKG